MCSPDRLRTFSSSIFYATASLLGAVACLLLWNIGQMPAMLIGAAVTRTLRLLAAHYRWSLPKAK